MFKKPFFGNGAIVSDDGYSVRLRDRYSLTYKRGELEVDVSCDTVPPNIDLLHGTATAVQAGQSFRLSGEQDEQVFEQIVAALEWDGYSVRLVT